MAKNIKQQLKEVALEYNNLVIRIEEIRKDNKTKDIIKEAAIQDMVASFNDKALSVQSYIYEGRWCYESK